MKFLKKIIPKITILINKLPFFNKKILFEKCIICKKKTNIPVSAPIKSRCFYVVGAGQLCGDCYMNLKREESYIPNSEEVNTIFSNCKIQYKK